MNEDRTSSGSGSQNWLDRLSEVFATAPRDRDQLIELLRAAKQRDLMDAEALSNDTPALMIACGLAMRSFT